MPKEHYLFNNFDDIFFFYVAVLFWLSHTNSIKHAIFIHKFHKAEEQLFFKLYNIVFAFILKMKKGNIQLKFVLPIYVIWNGHLAKGGT